jgi:membrane-associated phospholipid phosphatase
VGQVALPVSALLVTLQQHDGRGTWELAESCGTTLAATQLLKASIPRTRPDGGHRSFPSGHTSSAFAGAAFLQRRYGWAWGAPAYLAAGLVGYSRVKARHHWTSDVLAGAALGVASNLGLTHHRARVAVETTARSARLALTW